MHNLDTNRVHVLHAMVWQNRAPVPLRRRPLAPVTIFPCVAPFLTHAPLRSPRPGSSSCRASSPEAPPKAARQIGMPRPPSPRAPAEPHLPPCLLRHRSAPRQQFSAAPPLAPWRPRYAQHPAPCPCSPGVVQHSAATVLLGSDRRLILPTKIPAASLIPRRR